MDKESHNNHSNSISNNISTVRDRDKNDGSGSLLLRASSDSIRQTTTSDLVLQWGNRKRLRCMKIQVKDDSSSPVQKTTIRVDRRVVRTDKDSSKHPTPSIINKSNINNSHNNNHNHNQSNGYPNLRQRPPSPQQPPQRILRILCGLEMVDSCLPRNLVRGPTICDEGNNVLADVSSNLKEELTKTQYKVPEEAENQPIFYAKPVVDIPASPTLRSRSTPKVNFVNSLLPKVTLNSETSSAMRGGQSNGSVRGIASPDRGAHDKRGTHNNHLNDNNNNKSAASSDTGHDSKKGGSPSGSGDAAQPVWPPKFVIALTNKEKEEDFMAIKGSKLPQRPKKRAKFIQRTLNLVSPGAWLCDLTLERYEVREKKISKKRPRGLKAMGNMDSDSE